MLKRVFYAAAAALKLNISALLYINLQYCEDNVLCVCQPYSHSKRNIREDVCKYRDNSSITLAICVRTWRELPDYGFVYGMDFYWFFWADTIHILMLSCTPCISCKVHWAIMSMLLPDRIKKWKEATFLHETSFFWMHINSKILSARNYAVND